MARACASGGGEEEAGAGAGSGPPPRQANWRIRPKMTGANA